MTMPDLYRQNRNQWIAIFIISLFIAVESVCRVQVLIETNNRIDLENYFLKNRIHNLELGYSKIMPSSLFDVTASPKHKNHKH